MPKKTREQPSSKRPRDGATKSGEKVTESSGASSREIVISWSTPKEARIRWLVAETPFDLAVVEAMYRAFLRASKVVTTAIHAEEMPVQTLSSRDFPASQRSSPSRKTTDTNEIVTLRVAREFAASKPAPETAAAAVKDAGSRVLMLLAQSGRDTELSTKLAAMSMVVRLSKDVLNYPTSRPLEDLSDDPAEDEEEATAKEDGADVAATSTDVVSSAVDPLSFFTMGTAAAKTSGVVGSAVPRGLASVLKRLPVRIEDDVLPGDIYRSLHAAFAPPTAPYWSQHHYRVEPPSPYFSFVLPFPEGSEAMDDTAVAVSMGQQFGALGYLAAQVRAAGRRAGFVSAKTPARFAELWAHNRPHACGHQMHFDSDDEGRGGIRNPCCGSISYFSSGDVGGPTVVTNQRHGVPRLATEGWLCWPAENRLAVFDGTFLHGVVPGKGVRDPSASSSSSSSASPKTKSAKLEERRGEKNSGDGRSHAVETGGDRRVTVMLALWPEIAVRRGDGHGSARAFPGAKYPPYTKFVDACDEDNCCGDAADCGVDAETPSTNVAHPVPENPSKKKNEKQKKDTVSGGKGPTGATPEWAAAVSQAPVAAEAIKRHPRPAAKQPFHLDTVWETLEGKPWPSWKAMPHYDKAFQGF